MINHPGNGRRGRWPRRCWTMRGCPRRSRIRAGRRWAASGHPSWPSTLEALGTTWPSSEGGPHEDWAIHGSTFPRRTSPPSTCAGTHSTRPWWPAGLRRHEHLIERRGLSA
ncbi:hypothetical protein QJS66_21090 [Kocuria rhizophila]|nr:hypothetical protein QJS66_21090 [Kocuria rhizophila]